MSKTRCRSRPGPPSLPRLETLEDRSCPSCTVTVTGHTMRIIGDGAQKTRRIDTNLARVGGQALFNLQTVDGRTETPPDAARLATSLDGGPVPLSARITSAFLRRHELLSGPARRMVVLAATSHTGDLSVLERAAAAAGLDARDLAAAEAAGLVTLSDGAVAFRHPLARSAVYSDASAQERRDAHAALARARLEDAALLAAVLAADHLDEVALLHLELRWELRCHAATAPPAPATRSS